jgi:5'-AMP-activated protein kinase catalytic alpha subunit
MQQNELNPVDKSYVKKCLQANQHNALTSYYYLTLKKRIIQGEALEDNAELVPSSALLMPKDRQTKKFQSIEP